MAEKLDAPTSSSTDTGSGPRGAADGVTPKAIIKNVDMSEEMQQESVDIASSALEKYNIEKDIAAQIKKEFDRKHGPTWHVVVGKNFGSYVTHATEVHVRKYSKQRSILVRETPELYKRITEPYIANFPPSRTQWVTEILSGRAEQNKILFSSPEFVILPDMKWDLHTVGSLYLVAIVRDPSLRSLRDLRGDLEAESPETKKRKIDASIPAPGSEEPSAESTPARIHPLGHIGLLKTIRFEAYRVAAEKWGIKPGGLRMWIHYQPSYYHFHVHIVNAEYEGAGMGMAVGQAHLLEDVISLLENSPRIFETITLTYGLGEQHGLYAPMTAAQGEW
ncbi:hypothetical protein D9758_007223 [Tetrapyrgos nigripes]|uniref:Dynein light chain 1, cytoplasmic n=1 Tax=Tetrapyrgos nigripes TaxID=182062 RepID=A0A8H5D0W5_9AGAR|nr:hypothetical protein D9758_007223 [Tetrapyrgos nigripes]